MSLIDRIKDAPKLRNSAVVATWPDEDGKPTILYALPLTVQDIAWIQKPNRHKDFLNQMQVAGMIDLIIRKAEDKKGDSVFTIEDKPTLMQERLEVISGIFGDLWGDAGDDPEKN